jgi:hypothetical protein
MIFLDTSHLVSGPVYQKTKPVSPQSRQDAKKTGEKLEKEPKFDFIFILPWCLGGFAVKLVYPFLNKDK